MLCGQGSVKRVCSSVWQTTFGVGVVFVYRAQHAHVAMHRSYASHTGQHIHAEATQEAERSAIVTDGKWGDNQLHGNLLKTCPVCAAIAATAPCFVVMT